ncbi:hypothetical protein HZA99_04440 [Candidatus Woesearchaeota archaeon]|nr:hypothetical protein [Candidatus Woesearchaeota archaeon]
MLTTTSIERQTAYITSIAALTSGSFIKPEAQMQPSYVKTKSGKHVSRVHLIGVVVALSDLGNSEVTVDDGSGKILARSFENTQFFHGVQLGDILRIIGKVRSFNEQVYLIPEIMKKITDKKFITLHKLLLEKCNGEGIGDSNPEEVGTDVVAQEVVEDIAVDADDTVPASPFDKLVALIKKLDTGDGAAIEEILQQEGSESEKLLQHLLELGEVFEIRPGRVKLLE